MKNTENCLSNANIIAVVNIKDPTHAVPIAKALVAGGVHHIEVTLRSAQALQAINKIAEQVPEIGLGAGTVINQQQFVDAASAGATFIFSPGFDPQLATFANQQSCKYIPGISNASQAQQALALGYQQLKLFPAVLSGGESLLRALHAPFPQLSFCPTGGINLNNLSAFLQLPYVFAVGGSWLVNEDMVQRQAWDEITAACQEAIASI